MNKETIDKNLLEEMYVEQKLSLKDIKKKLNKSTNCIRKAIKEYQLVKELSKEDRIRQKGEIEIPLEDIQELYISQKLSIETIANRYQVSKNKIKNLIELYRINKRDKKEVFDIIHEKSRKTMKSKHGVEYTYQVPEIRDKMVQKIHEVYATNEPQKKLRYIWANTDIDERRRLTSLLKYGTDIPSKNKGIIAKISRANKETFSTGEPIRKRKETSIQRYGSEHYGLTKAFKDRLPQIIQKSYETRKNNGTLFIGESYRERRVFNLLKTRFYNIKRNYKEDPRYPFKCDFYIPDLDLFIEFNGHQYHYKEPFNKDNPQHVKRLEKLRTKEEDKKSLSNKKTQYTRMIKVWTIEDPLKRETAKNNKLNFKEFWSIEEVENWLRVIKPFYVEEIEKSLGVSLENMSTIKIEYHTENKEIQSQSLAAKEKGVFIYHIFEHEWLTKREQIINQLRNLLKLNEHKIYARQCEVKEVATKEAKSFLEENHLQGADKASIRLGLYFNKELVSIMTFGKPRFNKQYEYELLRFCSKANTTVVGGASKLFKHFIKTYNPNNVLSYSNIAHTKGELYPLLGFRKLSISSPNYVWVRGDETLTRYQCQKHKLVEKFPEYKDLSETEIMTLLGYEKLEDCGNITWLYEVENERH